jgi:hypothetical protein
VSSERSEGFRVATFCRLRGDPMRLMVCARSRCRAVKPESVHARPARQMSVRPVTVTIICACPIPLQIRAIRLAAGDSVPTDGSAKRQSCRHVASIVGSRLQASVRSIARVRVDPLNRLLGKR